MYLASRYAFISKPMAKSLSICRLDVKQTLKSRTIFNRKNV